MSRSRRHRYSLRGVELIVTRYPRGHPRPGVEVELETPWAAIGGYLHA